MNETTDTAVAVKPLVTVTDEGVNVPEAGDIAKYPTAKLSQLMDEMVQHGLVPEAISGFAKMSVPDKRDALIKLIGSLSGEEVGAAEAEKAAAPETQAPTEAKADASAEVVKEADKKVADKAKETKAATKTKVSGKGASDNKPKFSVVGSDDDPIVKFAHRVENLTERGDAENMIRDLQEEGEFGDFKLGGLLSKIQSMKWWEEAGYESFRDYVESTHGIKYRKAMYTIEIYRGLLEAEVSFEQFGNIGWSKILKLLPVVNKDNVVEWVEKAKALNVLSLENHVKAALNPTVEGAKAAEQPAPAAVKTMTFKLHPDQEEIVKAAVDKAKKDGKTDVASVALEYMAQSYMGNSGGFSSLKSALIAERKIAGTAENFVTNVVALLEELAPELLIEVSISDKPQGQAAA